jgi:hypothetical protein
MQADVSVYVVYARSSSDAGFAYASAVAITCGTDVDEVCAGRIPGLVRPLEVTLTYIKIYRNSLGRLSALISNVHVEESATAGLSYCSALRGLIALQG